MSNYHRVLNYEFEDFYSPVWIKQKSLSLSKLGKIYQSEGKLTAAEKYYKKSIDYSYNQIVQPESMYQLGLFYFQTNEFSQAIKTFRKAIELDSKWPGPYYYIAKCYEKIGNITEAENYYNKASELGHPLAQQKLDSLRIHTQMSSTIN